MDDDPLALDGIVLARLDALYAQLPAMACRGLCEDSCGPIGASEAELARVRSVGGPDLLAPRSDPTCPALSRSFGRGHCSVYAVRPMVCRLWGVAASMPCPHGCRPEGGLLEDGEAMRLMLTSIEVGGRVADLRVRELLEACLDDEESRVMLGAMLRGRRAVRPVLAARLAQLRGGGGR